MKRAFFYIALLLCLYAMPASAFQLIGGKPPAGASTPCPSGCPSDPPGDVLCDDFELDTGACSWVETEVTGAVTWQETDPENFGCSKSLIYVAKVLDNNDAGTTYAEIDFAGTEDPVWMEASFLVSSVSGFGNGEWSALFGLNDSSNNIVVRIQLLEDTADNLDIVSYHGEYGTTGVDTLLVDNLIVLSSGAGTNTVWVRVKFYWDGDNEVNTSMKVFVATDDGAYTEKSADNENYDTINRLADKAYIGTRSTATNQSTVYFDNLILDDDSEMSGICD